MWLNRVDSFIKTLSMQRQRESDTDPTKTGEPLLPPFTIPLIVRKLVHFSFRSPPPHRRPSLPSSFLLFSPDKTHCVRKLRSIIPATLHKREEGRKWGTEGTTARPSLTHTAEDPLISASSPLCPPSPLSPPHSRSLTL